LLLMVTLIAGGDSLVVLIVQTFPTKSTIPIVSAMYRMQSMKASIWCHIPSIFGKCKMQLSMTVYAFSQIL